MARASRGSASHLAGIGLVVVAVLSTTCRIGPKYTRPSAPVAPKYKELGAPQVTAEWKPAEPGDEATRGKWWEAFKDPRLNELEEKLNISNQTIAAAAANVQIVRAMIRIARSQFFPTVTINPSILRQHVPSAFGRSVGITFTEYSLPVEASWEPDLWGRVRKSVQANTYAAQAAVADLENVRLSAQAELASDYYQLRAQDALKQVLDSIASTYKEAFEIARVSFVSGRSGDEAVAQAEALWRAAEAQDTNVGVLRAQYEHAIAVLVGQPASTFSIPVDARAAHPPTIPVGVPSELLERRPDIAAAERTVAQANAQIGVAKTAYFPTLTLNGSAGVLSVSLARLFSWPSRVWSVGPTLVQTLFDGGLRRATVEEFEATYDQNVANYRQTVLTAFQQVEDNLSALRILTQVIADQDAAIDAARRGLEVADVRYRAGIDPYLDVIAAATILLDLEQTAVTYRMQRMIASVQLITALGGGWDASQIPSAKQLINRTPDGSVTKP